MLSTFSLLKLISLQSTMIKLKINKKLKQTKQYYYANSAGGAVVQWVERAVRRSLVRFPLRPPAPYWSGRCQYVTGWDRRLGLPALSHVWQTLCFGARPRWCKKRSERKNSRNCWPIWYKKEVLHSACLWKAEKMFWSGWRLNQDN